MLRFGHRQGRATSTRILTATLAVLLLVATIQTVAERPADAATAVFPIAVDPGASKQMITVSASAGSTTGTLQTYEKTATGWVEKFPAQVAKVGSAGLTTNARDFYPGTPIGKFSLTESFGRQPNPGTKLSYFKTDNYDWWAGDKSKPSYNNRVRCVPGSCPMSENLSEHLLPIGAVYDYSVVMNYNRFPAVAGKGAAFFLHVTNGKPTAGCVAIAKAPLVQIMRWLDPAKKPIIAIGNPKVTRITYNNDPIGKQTTGQSGSAATVGGWTWDPDQPTTPVNVHVYVNGRYATQARADKPSPSVAAAYPQAGNKHGYTIPVQLGPGANKVCTYAINLGPPGTNPALGCSTIYGRADWYLVAGPGRGPITTASFGTSPKLAGQHVFGCDIDGSGRDRLTTFRNGVFTYANDPATGTGVTTRNFGVTGDVGFCGDWDGDGIDTPGVRRGSVMYLSDSRVTGGPQRNFVFGFAGDVPLVGDWTGVGRDSVGLWRSSTASAYLRPVATSAVLVTVKWGASGVRVVTGDWNNDGIDTLGAFRAGRWELSNQKTGNAVSAKFTFGLSGDVPVTGRWGLADPATSPTAIGVVR